MKQIVLNCHIHSLFSDGHATYAEIAEAAAGAGVDVIVITDHNVFPVGLEGYYPVGSKQVLVLTGEEIHDQIRTPQKNHLLAFNPHQDFSPLAYQPQVLIHRVNESGGLTFIAHPVDLALKAIGEPNISWEDWSVTGFTGLEIWNGFSEIKTVSHNLAELLFYALFPDYLPHQPIPETLAIWDQILAKGNRCTAICGADAHCLPIHIGPFHRDVFPYSYHFKTLNNHVLLEHDLSGNLLEDKKQIFSALRIGRSFIGYDLPRNTSAFHFSAQGKTVQVTMGEEIDCHGGITFQIRTPEIAKIVLICDGKVIRKWKGVQTCTYTTSNPGAYRVEAWIPFLGKRRGWIFSNPIYVR